MNNLHQLPTISKFQPRYLQSTKLLQQDWKVFNTFCVRCRNFLSTFKILCLEWRQWQCDCQDYLVSILCHIPSPQSGKVSVYCYKCPQYLPFNRAFNGKFIQQWKSLLFGTFSNESDTILIKFPSFDDHYRQELAAIVSVLYYCRNRDSVFRLSRELSKLLVRALTVIQNCQSEVGQKQ